MRIVLAPGIFPPEIGGPAYYASSLRDEFQKEGHTVDVVLPRSLRHLPPGVRHIVYAWKLYRAALRADAIITFDTWSVGMPAALAAFLARRTFVVRVGGDALWESYVERSKQLIPLPEFYRTKPALTLKERLIFWSTRLVLRRARVVFSSDWQRELWRDAYRLPLQNTHVIDNAIEAPLAPIEPSRKNFILFARQIALKNVDGFARAIEKAKEQVSAIELDTGMVPHAELLSRIQACYAVALPSVSDVTPNYILDAIRCGKPFLLTKHSAYAELYKDYGVIVDPLDEGDMTRGILELADAQRYAELAGQCRSFNAWRGYGAIAREFLAVIETPSSL